MRRIGLFPVAILTCAMAACSTEPPPAPAAPSLPARPFSVALDGVDLCDTLTTVQQNRLGVGDQNDGVVNVNGKPSPVCTWLGDNGIDYNVQVIDFPANAAISEPGSTVVMIGRFGGVLTVPTETMSGSALCQVTVDAGPDKSVRVQALTRPGGPTPGIDEQCRRASDVASEVLITLTTASR